MTGDGEFLRMNLFGDWQGEAIPISIALLFVRRDGIMDLGLHAVVAEILLQFITTRTEHGEDVPDGGGRSLRQTNQGIVYLREIDVGNGAATLVVNIEMGQFGIEDGGLEFVDAGVAPLIVEDVLTMRAIVAESTNDSCQFLIVRRHGTSITEGTKVLRGIERMAGGIAKGAGASIYEAAAVGLSVVLDEFETMLLTYLPYPIRISTETIEMNDHHGTRTRGDSGLDEGVIYLERMDVGLDEHGLQSALGDSEDTGNIGIGRYDDLIARDHHTQFNISTKNERQCIKSITTAYAIFRTNVLSVMRLKLFRGLALEIPAATQHLVGSMFVRRVNGLQIQIFYHKSYSYQS